MHLALGFGFLVAMGLPLAYALTRRVAVALVLAPLLAGVLGALGTMAMVTFGGELWIWVLALFVGEVALAAWLLRRPRVALPAVSWVDALFYLPFLLMLPPVKQPAVVWDPRSVWWFHATWFDAGADAARGALANPALAFSHPDYPPLVPSAIAAAWRIGGSTSLVVAQAVSGLLTVCAAMLLAYSVRQLVVHGSPWVARLAGLAAGLSLWWLAPAGIASGYVDHLWAAALATAVVLLLVDGDATRPAPDDAPPGGRGTTKLGLAVVLLAVAALTKNEGLVAAVLVAVVFTVRGRRRWRTAAWAWLPVGLGVLWVVVARTHGAVSDLSQSGSIGQLVHGDLTALERAQPTLTALRATVGWVVAGAAAITLLGVATLRSWRRRTGWASTAWLWALVGAYAATLVLSYVISPYRIDWHLATSIDRVCVPIVVLLTVNTATWLLTAVGARGVPGDEEPAPDEPPQAAEPPDAPTPPGPPVELEPVLATR